MFKINNPNAITGENIKDRTKMAAIRTMLDMKTDIITDSKKEAKLKSEEENEALYINCTISTLQAQHHGWKDQISDDTILLFLTLKEIALDRTKW